MHLVLQESNLWCGKSGKGSLANQSSCMETVLLWTLSVIFGLWLLLTLARAIRDSQRVRFDYKAADGTPSARRADPVRIVDLAGRWYLMAFDVGRDDWRSFRVDRMRSVTVWVPGSRGVDSGHRRRLRRRAR